MKELAENLKKANLKVTPQRLAVYSFLIGSKEHPSVETIYKALRPEYPSMSLATVYKTVAALRDAHLVTEFNVCEDSHRYDANTAFHTHLICKKCHNVYDCDVSLPLNRLCNEIDKNNGFAVENEEVNFYGVCENCR